MTKTIKFININLIKNKKKLKICKEFIKIWDYYENSDFDLYNGGEIYNLYHITFDDKIHIDFINPLVYQIVKNVVNYYYRHSKNYFTTINHFNLVKIIQHIDNDEYNIFLRSQEEKMYYRLYYGYIESIREDNFWFKCYNKKYIKYLLVNCKHNILWNRCYVEKDVKTLKLVKRLIIKNNDCYNILIFYSDNIPYIKSLIDKNNKFAFDIYNSCDHDHNHDYGNNYNMLIVNVIIKLINRYVNNYKIGNKINLKNINDNLLLTIVKNLTIGQIFKIFNTSIIYNNGRNIIFYKIESMARS